MRVRFLQVASVAGVGYRPGNTADLRDDVAQAYIRVGQAEPYEAPEEAEVEGDEGDEADDADEKPKPRRGRKPTARKTRNVETAADEGRETR